jgi:hypothetical protein
VDRTDTAASLPLSGHQPSQDTVGGGDEGSGDGRLVHIIWFGAGAGTQPTLSFSYALLVSPCP